MVENAYILIVDDEPKICEFLEVLLKRESYRVSSVHTASDALAHAAQTPPDLVITDLKMPGMDGFELVTRLKERNPGLPIVMITGYATVETAVKALRHGVDDYVTKPFNIDELRKVVSRALGAARAEAENRRLVTQIEAANAELARAKELLAEKVRLTGDRLEEAQRLMARQKGQLRVLRDLSALAANEQDAGRLLHQLALQLRAGLGARYSSIMLREGDDLVVRAFEGERSAGLLGLHQPIEEGVAGRVAREQKPLLISNVEATSSESLNGERRYRTSSFVSVPIIQHGRTLGVINVCDKNDGSVFTQDDLDMVRDVAERIAPAMENASLYRALEQRCLSVVEALADMLDARDPNMAGHSQRVRDYACRLAQAAGATPAQVEMLGHAAQLHNIGQMAVPESIMEKHGRLDNEERKTLQRHPAAGENVVKALGFLHDARSIIRHHHEHWDGSGYPDRLAGQDIPRLARVLTVADAFDAMVSERPHRPAMSQKEAAAELRRMAGTQFDDELTRIFCDQVLRQ